MAACHPRPFPFSISRWAITGRAHARIIRGQVLSEHIEAAIAAVKIAATHHAGSHFLEVATAFCATASVERQPQDREF